jgi:hypothetical protein
MGLVTRSYSTGKIKDLDRGRKGDWYSQTVAGMGQGHQKAQKKR